MKKGLLALILLALVAAIPACKQRDCNDKDRGCNPCSWLKCRKKCDKPERREKKPKKKCKSFCDMLRCKKSDRDEMMDEDMAPRREEVSRERIVREDMAPAARRMK